jgi:flagellar basal body-associated protein FliL
MAEIHVQKKRNSWTWVWILVLLLILGGIVAYVMLKNQEEQNKTSNQPGPTSFFQLPGKQALYNAMA